MKRPTPLIALLFSCGALASASLQASYSDSVDMLIASHVITPQEAINATIDYEADIEKMNDVANDSKLSMIERYRRNVKALNDLKVRIQTGLPIGTQTLAEKAGIDEVYAAIQRMKDSLKNGQNREFKAFEKESFKTKQQLRKVRSDLVKKHKIILKNGRA